MHPIESLHPEKFIKKWIGKKTAKKDGPKKKLRAETKKKKKKVVKRKKNNLLKRERCPTFSFFLCPSILIPHPKNSSLSPKQFRNHLA